MDDHSLNAVCRRLILVLAAVIVLALGVIARGDSIRLRGETQVTGSIVALRDIAELEGPLATRFADVPVAEFSASATQMQVSMTSVRQRLTDAGANWGLLSLRGYASCRVHRPSGGKPDDIATETPEPDALQGSAASAAVPDDMTLRSLIVRQLAELAETPITDLRVTFHDRDETMLQRSIALGRYEIEPLGTAAIGRVPLVLRRYEAGRVVETLDMTVDVEKRVTALVATQTISRGDDLAGKVAVREVHIDHDRRDPLTDPALLQGQKASALLREGHVLYPEHIEAPVMIRRGELVTVRCVSGALAVRTVGRAAQDGRLDEQIQIRNKSTRESFLATVTGAREVAVQLDSQPPRAAGHDQRGER